tara:strand:- start:302 stop:499 length:198 start_codon:yes stop_codon:yes gene_type:complete
LILLVIILVLWEIYWTIKACWLAAKNDDKGWFIFMLVFNLLGIPEMIYIYNHNKKIGIEDNTKDK